MKNIIDLVTYAMISSMKNFDFYSQLSIEEQEFLKKNSQYIELPKQTLLFYQGDTCKDILLLEEGSVKLSIYGEKEEIPLYEIRRGEQCIVNTASTISKTSAIATAETISEIKGWLVPQEIIKELSSRSSVYQEFLFSLFSLKFFALTTLIEDIKFKRLDTRVMEYLQKQNTQFIEMTHEDLASTLGTSRVVISRVLKDLERKELIKLHRKKIELIECNTCY